MSKKYMSNGRSNYQGLYKKQDGLTFCRKHECWYYDFCYDCKIEENG